MHQALLGFLMQGPAHGYALHDRAQDDLGRIWYMGMSNVYGTLKDLENAAHVESTLEDDSYPPRKVYSITPEGRETFLAWVQAPVPAMRDVRVEFLAKLYFFHTLQLHDLEGLLDAQREACVERLKELGSRASEPIDAFDRVVTDFRRRRIEACLDWLSAAESELT
jgi:DNA-binding PadR family transcriptional regulator